MLAKGYASATAGGSDRIAQINFYRGLKIAPAAARSDVALGPQGSFVELGLGMWRGCLRVEERFRHLWRLINHFQDHIAIFPANDGQ